MTSFLELSERLAQVSDIYAKRFDIRRDDDWYALKLQEEAGELVAEYLRGSGRGRVKDRSADEQRAALADEAADLLAQLLLFCRHHKIDPEAALQRKWLRYLDAGKSP